MGRLTYAYGQKIGSKSRASEKRQQTSDLEEQSTPETRQSGALQWKQKYDEEGDENTLSKSRRTELSH